MENRLLEIIKQLNDYRSKLSALYSLYNSSMLTAEESRVELSGLYEQMIDFKNDLNSLTSLIASVKKAERVATYNQNKSRIKRIVLEVETVNDGFKENCNKYKIALEECGGLKKEYKHEVSELCKEFKANVDENTDTAIIKGYKQQVKIIKAILDKIELLISDYNVKKNNVVNDSENFGQLYDSVNSLIDQLQSIA